MTRFRGILLLFFIVVSSWQTSFAAPMCRDIFAVTSTASRGAVGQIVSQYVMTEIRKESDSLKRNYSNRVLEVDNLCVGAGPHCAAVSLVLSQGHGRNLVLEKTNLVAKTFAEKDFFINSHETTDLTMNHFPGGVGYLANFTRQKYATSGDLAAYIQTQQYASGVNVLLGTKMQSIKEAQSPQGEYFEIKTDQGVTIRAKNLILGLGLGEVDTKIRDAGYRAAFEAFHQNFLAHPDTLQPIMATDSFLAAIKNARLEGKQLQLPKNIIVVGNGDGSRITIENFSDPAVKAPTDLHIDYVGNNYSNAAEYVASREGDDRYLPYIVPYYERKQIRGVDGHVMTWLAAANGTMSMKTETSQASGELIIDSTGYKNQVSAWVSSLSGQAQLASVKGPLPELGLSSTVLAKQAVDSATGHAYPLYVVGPSAGSLSDSSELVNSPNQNPVAMFNTIPRTSIFTSRQFNLPEFTSNRGARTERPDVLTPTEIIQKAQQARAKKAASF